MILYQYTVNSNFLILFFIIMKIMTAEIIEVYENKINSIANSRLNFVP